MQRTDSFKDPDAGKDWRQEEKGTTEDEMVGWHCQLDGHELEQAPGVGDGQESLACCSPRDHKESDTTERLNWTELYCSPPGSSVHGILQTRILEWVAISFSRKGSNLHLLLWQVDPLPLSNQVAWFLNISWVRILSTQLLTLMVNYVFPSKY